MNTKNKYQIFYCCNDKMFDALYLSILSTVRRTKASISFYVLSGDFPNSTQYKTLTKKHQNIIQQIIKKYNDKCTFKVLNATKAYFDYCKKNNENNWDVKESYTPYTLFRCLPHKFFTGKILYVDCDTMVSGDVSEAFNYKMENTEMYVTRDSWFHHLNHFRYFNAGVILFNIEVVKKTKLLDKAFEYFFKKRPIWNDQSALNKVWTNIKYWDDSRFNQQDGPLKQNTVIYHFVRRPIRPRSWEIEKVFKNVRKYNWYEFLPDFVEFCKMKKIPKQAIEKLLKKNNIKYKI